MSTLLKITRSANAVRGEGLRPSPLTPSLLDFTVLFFSFLFFTLLFFVVFPPIFLSDLYIFRELFLLIDTLIINFAGVTVNIP